jgi:hypothetical protein
MFDSSKMKSNIIRLSSCGLAALSGLLGIAGIADASSFTQGNLVVVRIGDGIATPTNASTAVFLDEYTPAGAFVQTIALPTAVSGSNNPLTN